VPPTNQEVENARIGNATVDGTADVGIQGPPAGSGIGSGVVEAPPAHTIREDSVYMDVQIESSYPGGPQAWIRFLQKNFHTPEQAISEGTGGTVVVQFIVDKDGKVSEVKAISGPEALQAEAVRVIKRSGQWSVAIQNGRKVNSYKRQPIIVELQDQ
jgi:protein TonB